MDNQTEEVLTQEGNTEENVEQNTEQGQATEPKVEKTEDNSEANKGSKRKSWADKYAELENKHKMTEKSYNELRSFSDRRYNQLNKELEFFAPYKDALKAAMDQKKQQEFQQLYQQNPIEAQRRLAEQIAQEKIAPFQQQFQEMQNNQVISETVNYLTSTYGKEVFESMRAPMAEILNETHQSLGPQVAEVLARRPDALMQMAVGRAYLQQVSQNQTKIAQGQSNQQKATKFAQGTARPNTSATKEINSYGNLSDKELEKLAYEELARMQR